MELAHHKFHNSPLRYGPSTRPRRVLFQAASLRMVGSAGTPDTFGGRVIGSYQNTLTRPDMFSLYYKYISQQRQFFH
jgi:hypothetical protein